MNTVRKLIAVATVLATSSGLCLAQTSSPAASPGSPAATTSSTTTSTMPGSATSPYTEGTVWRVTMVHAKPGMSDDYLKGLAKNLKTSLEEQKKQGLVVSYKILLGDASTPGDFDIMNMVEYKNMAALDGLRDKTDPIAAKITGGEQQQRDAAIKRAELREIIGSKIMREIMLK